MSQPVSERRYGDLRVRVYADSQEMGAAAAADVARKISECIAARDKASLVLATGNSQLSFLAALRQNEEVRWDKVLIFHLDEYLGISEDHPASFRHYLRTQIVEPTQPKAFHPIQGDAGDIEAELQRYTSLLEQHPADICVMGIGENGHLAFNDPPADFHARETIRVVELDEACRRQQVGEGHFASIENVPEKALTLTVPALLAARDVFIVVPEQRKAEAVRAALEGPVTPDCPASILREQAHARLYLDRDAASLLKS